MRERDLAEPIALTIGNFDGVHIGHQSIIGILKDEAEKRGLCPCVMTFKPHTGGVKTILLDREKAEIFDSLEVRQIVMPFDDALKNASPGLFVDMLAALGCRLAVVGGSFRFGKGRAGGVGDLRRLGAGYGIDMIEAPPVMLGGAAVSSSRVRRLIGERDFGGVRELLGRPYSVSGEVAAGRKVGRALGYPTVNLGAEDSKLYPPNGVYFTKATVGGKRFDSVTNVGVRPTFGGGGLTIEAFLIDFGGESVYGEPARVEFFGFDREERRFADAVELKSELETDIAKAKDFWIIQNLGGIRTL